ncbi:MAG: beta-ketoacyl-ACP synthase II [Salibacteraceae bacterium]
MAERRVVITGIGAVTSIGNTISETWTNAIKGVSGAGPITRFDASLYKTRFACEVKNFEIEKYLSKKDARKYDLYTHFGIGAAEEAMQDAGLNSGGFDPERAGVIWSSGNGGLQTFEDLVIEHVEGGYQPRYSPFFVTKVIGNTAAGLISIRFNLQGINYDPVAACASSGISIIEAFNHIKWNKAEVIIAGGSEAPITPSTIGGFGAMRALSTENDNPASASRPFDATRTGFVAGEGGAGMVLEEYEHAKARGARIYAEVVGGGISSDAHHIAMSHPEGRGAYLSMKNALKEAEINPQDIDYINVHATSTPIGDIAEAKALSNLYKGDYGNMCISATKSMTGHLMGGAGALEGIFAVKSIETQEIAPTINTNVIDERIDQNIDMVKGDARKKKVDYSMSNTFGFGGHNASVVFKKC